MPSRRTFASRIASGLYSVGESSVFTSEDWIAMLADLPAAASVVGTDLVPITTAGVPYTATAADILAYIAANASGTWGISITGSAPAGSLTGTTLAANVVTSSLTTIGTLVAGAVPASLVTAGTFGAGNYATAGTLAVAAGAADDAFIVTSTFNGFQAKVRYDASNRFEFGVTSTGDTTLRSVGSSPNITMRAGSLSTGAISIEGTGVSLGSRSATATITSTHASTARIRYDASNYLGIAVSAAGAVTFNAVGASAAFTFSDAVTISALVNTTESYQVDGTKVVGNQGVAVADATDATTVITQLNTLLARLRDHGLIAT